ncbi:MAG: hypothetical protein OEZ14_07325 [Acidimicrobiia bacterium]|nr:hypothetical protein [Acidimicrobiia bacterium]
MISEVSGHVFGSIVTQDVGHGYPEAFHGAANLIDERNGHRRVDRSDHDPNDGPTGTGVDRGQLVDLADSFEMTDVEAVNGDQVARGAGPMTEPERFVLGNWFGD